MTEAILQFSSVLPFIGLLTHPSIFFKLNFSHPASFQHNNQISLSEDKHTSTTAFDSVCVLFTVLYLHYFVGHYAALYKWMRCCGGGRNVTWQSPEFSLTLCRNIQKRLHFISTKSGGHLLRYDLWQCVCCKYLHSKKSLKMICGFCAHRDVNIDKPNTM
jgi:hypothetical protein